MGKSCGKHKFLSLGGQYYSLGHPIQYSSTWHFKNGGILRGQNVPLKYCQPFELLLCIGKRFRSFHRGNFGSVGQKGAKLLSVKLWEWFEQVGGWSRT